MIYLNVMHDYTLKLKIVENVIQDLKKNLNNILT